MVDNSKELERLRRQLKEVTAERERLLSEIRRLRHEYAIGAEELEQTSLPLTSTSPGSLPATTEPDPRSITVNNESPYRRFD